MPITDNVDLLFLILEPAMPKFKLLVLVWLEPV